MYEREGFRGYLDRLRSRNQLVDLREPVDSRHIATLVDQSDKALMFQRVIGYDMPVVSGLIRSSERMAIGMGVERYADIEQVLTRALASPIAGDGGEKCGRRAASEEPGSPTWLETKMGDPELHPADGVGGPVALRHHLADQGHDHALHDRVHDLGEGGADDDGDG